MSGVSADVGGFLIKFLEEYERGNFRVCVCVCVSHKNLTESYEFICLFYKIQTPLPDQHYQAMERNEKKKIVVEPAPSNNTNYSIHTNSIL